MIEDQNSIKYDAKNVPELIVYDNVASKGTVLSLYHSLSE